MLELGAGAGILRALGWLYLGLMALLVGAALWFPERWWQKLIGAIVVLMVFVGPAYLRNRERSQLIEEHKARYEKARAIFDERCKTAGEKIYKTVDDVEGVLLLNLRANDRTENEANPNWPDAGLPNEYSGDAYIDNFLAWEHHEDKRNPRGYLNQAPSDLPGYRYIDTEGKDGQILRYTLRRRSDPDYPRLAKTEIRSSPARYAVSFTNLINPSDRQHWVAGTTVTVTDTQTLEVLARATWYSFEPGLGSTAGGRQPWRFARSCPELRGGQERAPTRFFVDQVLKPKKGE